MNSLLRCDGCVERGDPPDLEVGYDSRAGVGVAGIDEHGFCR
ncbi:hypothetical protein [Methanosphaerula palustris]|nr:hypothetical protein [Methanosphaerula palustris]